MDSFDSYPLIHRVLITVPLLVSLYLREVEVRVPEYSTVMREREREREGERERQRDRKTHRWKDADRESERETLGTYFRGMSCQSLQAL